MSDRDQDLALKAVQDAGLDPLDPTQVEPSTWTHFGFGTGMGVMRGAAKTGRAAMVLAGGTIGTAMDAIANAGHRSRGEPESTGFQDNTFQAADDIGQNAVDYWTPGPNEVGKAGQVLGGLAEIAAPLAAGGGNPALLMASTGTNTGTELVNQGVDAQTASLAAATDIAATGFGFKIPFLGKNLLTRALTGAAGNVAVNAGATELTHASLQSGGYSDLAGRYDPLDPTARTIDVLTGLGFGAIAHASAKPSDVDAALTARNAEHFQETAHPGTPADARSSMQAQTALSTAIEQALRGDKVDIASHIRAADFMAPVTTEGQPIAEALASIEGSPQHAQLSNYAAFRHALESGGKADAANPNSSAVGVDQFTAPTWRAVVAQAKPAWADGLSDAQLLAARKDPAKSAEMVAHLDAENASALRAAGQPVDNLTLYAAHHFGSEKAIAFAQAGEDTPLSQILTKGQLKANPYLADMTKGEAIANWNQRAARAGVAPSGERIAEADIVNPIDRAATPEAKLEQIHALSAENKPVVDDFLRSLDEQLGTSSKSSLKTDESILAKASRPSILAEKPYHDIEHVRDTLRFKTVIDSVDQLPAIADAIKAKGWEVVKVDTDKMVNPKAWGWRFAALDLRMPNGQIVEHYMPLRELEAAKKAGNHLLFEKWRAVDERSLTPERAQAMLKDMQKSRDSYDAAYHAALARSGTDEAAARASLSKFAARSGSVTTSRPDSSPMVKPAAPQRPLARTDEKPSGARTQTSSPPGELVTTDLTASDMGVSSTRILAESSPSLHAVDHLAAEHPHALIAAGFDEDGNPRYSTVADARADIEAEHARAVADADAFEAAVNCHLRRGPDYAG